MFRTSLFALGLAVVPTAATVSGSGTITFGTSVEHITVNATGSSGRATFQDKAAGGNVNGQIDINCVNIVGNTATLSGSSPTATRNRWSDRRAFFGSSTTAARNQRPTLRP